jgi:hypothetical protein
MLRGASSSCRALIRAEASCTWVDFEKFAADAAETAGCGGRFGFALSSAVRRL